MPEPNRLKLSRSAAHALTDTLPEKIATAVHEFITGPLLDNPQRVGKPLAPPLAPAWTARRGTYRILYFIDADKRLVEVTTVRHRADAHNT